MSGPPIAKLCAAAAILVTFAASSAEAAGPKIVSGPSADAQCFVPWTEKTKFFQYAKKPGPSLKGKTLPRVLTLGGDHTITLPLLRSMNRAYGPITVIHFDSHL